MRCSVGIPGFFCNCGIDVFFCNCGMEGFLESVLYWLKLGGFALIGEDCSCRVEWGITPANCNELGRLLSLGLFFMFGGNVGGAIFSLLGEPSSVVCLNIECKLKEPLLGEILLGDTFLENSNRFS